jgi:hypothetical protein
MLSKISNASKSWSVAIFERERPYIANFVKSSISNLLDDDDCRFIVVHGPVKSGKREIVEYCAVRDQQSSQEQVRLHAFISAWHRINDASQREELKNHGLKVFSIITQKCVNECLDWIEKQIKSNKQIILHLDECDHGSGENQKLSQIWRKIRTNPNVKFILYSATPEEVRFSGEINDENFDEMMDELGSGHNINYTPPEGFCGPKRFLEENLVFDAKPFFTIKPTYELSVQGRQIVHDLLESMKTDPNRNIIVLRLSYSNSVSKNVKQNKAIYQFIQNLQSFPELNDFIIMSEGSEKFKDTNKASNFLTEEIKWSNPIYWRGKASNVPTIIVIDQTSSRSTEWSCHNRIFATHDYRNSLIFSVASQAQERTNHYEQKYEGFQPIKIYGHRNTFLLSAGIIDYTTYLKNKWKMVKVDKRISELPLYNIKDTDENTIHPNYAEPMTEDCAEQVLQILDSYVEISVSSRVRGSVRRCQEITCRFEPCNSQNFQVVGATKNPFIKSNITMERYPERYPTEDGQIGFLRDWGVYQYSYIDENKGWGFSCLSTAPRVTICYNEGVLGVAIRTPTGIIVEKNTLNSYKSMYKSK